MNHQRIAAAAAHAALQARTDARLEDLQWLLDMGTPLVDALPRVGWTPVAAERALRRRGLLELARRCGQLVKAARAAA